MKETYAIKRVNALEWYMALQENSSLGLGDKVKKKFDKVDAVDNLTQIQFEDPEVEHICHKHGVYTIGDAIKVSSIKEWFNKNRKIQVFNEFKYFTGLKDIKKSTFEGCTNLQSVIIPNSVTILRNFAFMFCASLKSISIPNSVTCIENWAFSHCESLQSIRIPDSVNRIGGRAFSNCYNLQSITIPSGVTSMGSSVFINCTSLQSVVIPDSVAIIGDNIFSNCKLLKVIYISKNCPVYNQIRKQYPNIQLIEPKVNESTNLGLNSKVKKNYEITHAQDIDINQLADFIRPKVYVAAGYSPDEDAEKVDYNLRVYVIGNCLVVDGMRICDESGFYNAIDTINSDIKREESNIHIFKDLYLPLYKAHKEESLEASALESIEKSNRQVSGLTTVKNELEAIGWFGILKAMTNSRD